MRIVIPTNWQLFRSNFRDISRRGLRFCAISHVFVANYFEVNQPECDRVSYLGGTLDPDFLWLLPDLSITKSVLSTSDGLMEKRHIKQKFRDIVIKKFAKKLVALQTIATFFCEGQRIRAIKN